LYYLEEMMLPEISEMLHIPLGTVCSRFERAKEYLQPSYPAPKNAGKHDLKKKHKKISLYRDNSDLDNVYSLDDWLMKEADGKTKKNKITNS
jgi:hypothetical protein